MEKNISKEVWSRVEKLREDGKLPPPTEEDFENEPTALANSEYRLNEKPYIYESPDKGKTIYRRKLGEYPIERERLK